MILRTSWRLIAGLSVVVLGLLICVAIFPFWSHDRRMQCVSWWSRLMLRALGVAFRPLGSAGTGVVLIAANHVSWLDILALNAWRPARFVSKAEVRRWPVIGWLAARAGTLFIERERRRDAMRVVHALAAALKAGETVAVFPEGVVGDGQRLLPFHANLLQAAVSTQTRVQPVAIRYVDEGPADSAAPARRRAADGVATAALLRGPSSPSVAYHGDVNIGQSMARVLKARGLAVVVASCPPIEPSDDRRRLADAARQAIADAFQGPNPPSA